MNIRASINFMETPPVTDIIDEDHGFQGEYGDLPGICYAETDRDTYDDDRTGETYVKSVRGVEIVAFDFGGLIIDRSGLEQIVGRSAIEAYETAAYEAAVGDM